MQKNQFRRKKGRFLFPFLFPILWLLLGAVVMWLWNAILPSLLHISTINYWQSVGLLLLCRILFGGFHFRKPGDRAGFGDGRFGNGQFGDMREKWMNMSQEERLKFKSDMRNRCRPQQKRDEDKNPEQS